MLRRLYVRLKKIKNSVFSLFISPPVIESTDESIEKIVRERCSVCRFGDGEISLILGGAIKFQKNNPKLGNRLREIINSNEHNLMVCIPNVFKNLDLYTDEFKEYWESLLINERSTWYKILNKNKIYYDALLSRFYTSFKDKSNSRKRFENIKMIWNEREVLIVEGEQTRMGVGNKLFSNAKSVQRILAPNKDAFEWYDKILETVKYQPRFQLVLISLGPTATVLAHDLHRLGFQAIDIGHLDIQYEYFSQNASSRINLSNKYVNEVEGGDIVEDVNDTAYSNSIISRIGI